MKVYLISTIWKKKFYEVLLFNIKHEPSSETNFSYNCTIWNATMTMVLEIQARTSDRHIMTGLNS